MTYQWKNAPGRQKSVFQRLFGIDWKGFAVTALILICLSVSLVMQQRTRPAPAPRGLIPVSRKIQQYQAPRIPARSSMEVAPRWGGMGFKPIEEQIEEYAAEPPAAAEPAAAAAAPGMQMPDISGLMAEQAKKFLKQQTGQAAQVSSSGAGGAVVGQAAAKPKEDEHTHGKDGHGHGAEAVEYKIVEGYRKSISHSHGSGPPHQHDGQGNSLSGPPHRHRVRYKVPVLQGSIPNGIMESLGVHKINLYRLEEIAREIEAESLRSGEEMVISDAQAREIAGQVGLTTGE